MNELITDISNLVFIENGKAITDSFTVAEVFGKDHDKVVRDIKNQIEKLNEVGEIEWGIANFEETPYQHPQNKQWYKKFNLTEDAFTIVAMSYVTPEAMKFKISFLKQFKKMQAMLQSPFVSVDGEINWKEISKRIVAKKKILELTKLPDTLLTIRAIEHEEKETGIDLTSIKELLTIEEFYEAGFVVKFLEEMCLPHAHAKVEAKVLFETYEKWRSGNNSPFVANRQLYKAIEAQGYFKRKGANNKLTFYGIELKSDNKQVVRIY